ncbi:MAG: OmpA family protein [Candidatus Dadabacteria bacterium]|nr:OmpA family protein [Candidatus Dadabacteria bacterium]MYC39599.1 OmpA family protein [Candidatus Dadabacteria bacterium]
MKKIVPAVAFLFLVVGVLHISGCSKKTLPPPPEEPSAEVEYRVLAVSEKLEEARAEGAEDTWEYEEAQKLFELAKSLVSDGEFEEAEKVLSQAELKATQAVGVAREDTFMEGFDEAAQEIRKSLLRDSFSRENLINLPTSDVFFEFDSSEIPQEAMDVIDGNIAIFEKNKDKIKFILVFGFCDIRGTEEYNLSLGKKRADEIKKYMIGKGMSPEMLHSISKGETEIWQEGTSEEAYGRNRRGHFIALSADSPSESNSPDNQ